MPEAAGEPEPVGQTDLLIHQARTGSKSALGQLLESCRAYLLWIANENLDADLRAKGGASDLVQQTFMEAQQAFDQFQGQTQQEWLNWLRGILRHNVADFRRRYRERQGRQVSQEQPISDLELAELRNHLQADTPSPEARVVQAEDMEALRRAIARLPEEYQRVVELRHEEGLGFEEIAQRLGRTAGAVRKTWFRAIGKLREELRVSDESGRKDVGG